MGKSEWIGTYKGNYNRTVISTLSDNSYDHECGHLKLEISQPDKCNKCAYLIVLTYTPYGATSALEPIALLGALDSEGHIHASGTPPLDGMGTVSHKFILNDCKLEHVLSSKYNGVVQDEAFTVWVSECDHLKRYKEKQECPCEKKCKKKCNCGCEDRY